MRLPARLESQVRWLATTQARASCVDVAKDVRVDHVEMETFVWTNGTVQDRAGKGRGSRRSTCKVQEARAEEGKDEKERNGT